MRSSMKAGVLRPEVHLNQCTVIWVEEKFGVSSEQ